MLYVKSVVFENFPLILWRKYSSRSQRASSISCNKVIAYYYSQYTANFIFYKEPLCHSFWADFVIAFLSRCLPYGLNGTVKKN